MWLAIKLATTRERLMFEDSIFDKIMMWVLGTVVSLLLGFFILALLVSIFFPEEARKANQEKIDKCWTVGEPIVDSGNHFQYCHLKK